MFHRSVLILTTAVVALVIASFSLPANAAVFATNKCVSAKQNAAAVYCAKSLQAWSTWDKKQDDAKRDASVQKALDVFNKKWGKADDASAKKGSDCTETTAAAADIQALIDSAVSDTVASINASLDLGVKDDAKCGGKLLTASAKFCQGILKAESTWIKKLDKDPDAAKRDESQTKATDKLNEAWGKEVAKGCSVEPTPSSVEAIQNNLKDGVVNSTIISPSVNDTQFTTISPTGTVKYNGKNISSTCAFDTPYHFFAKRGTVNKLVMYYQGGGACWEQLTCGIPVCDDDVDPNGNDNPNNFSSGFADLLNPLNPVKDWHIVFVSYCSCDIHFGDASQDYNNTNPGAPLHVEHRGFQNSRIAEKWAREHFVNPEQVLVTGSSAGAYGALFNGPIHKDQVWPASKFSILADAGNGVITSAFLQNEFSNWDFTKNLPKKFPELKAPIDDGSGMVGYIDAVTDLFPTSTWAHYSSAFDGGFGGQTGFYNVMLNDSNPIAALSWWEGSCAFNSVMRSQVQQNAALDPDNYRYYIGTGSRHTMWGSNKVYDDTTGGVPTIADWLQAMIDSDAGAPDPGWTNVEASPFNVLLPGDVRPAVIPTAPFILDPNGAVIVDCP